MANEASGSMPSSKPAKQPKPAKPSSSTQTAPDASSSSKPAKPSKDSKKEKRAALVAARAAASTGEASDPRALAAEQIPRSRPGLTSGHITNSTTAVPNAPPALKRGPSHAIQPNAEPSSSQTLFFSHLPPHLPPDTPAAYNGRKLHPEVIRLGVLMADGTLRGANARTKGLMAAFQEVIRDYECPEAADLWKDLPIYLSPMIAWLDKCRPKGVGGGNAIRWLKSEINKLGEGDERTDAEQKEYLVEAIGIYVRDRIEFADQVLADHAKEKINPGETIVTFARSSIVEQVLLEAWADMKEDDPSASFEVVVVDSRPLNEGRDLLDTLAAAGIDCTYVLLAQAASVIKRASLVLLGASALHSDGALYSRSGTAMVAMLAKEYRVPVVACVETYKFAERVVLDSVASNELGLPDILLDIPTNQGVAIKQPAPAKLASTSLMYDLTPPDLITAVCTEIGFIPPSSVPTVLGKASATA